MNTYLSTRSTLKMITVAALFLGGCSSGSPSANDGIIAKDGPPTLSDGGRKDGDGPIAIHDGPQIITDGPAANCAVGAKRCAGTKAEAICQLVNAEHRWVESGCATGETCVDDHCLSACVDECYYGEERQGSGGTERCMLYSEATSSFGALGAGTHDRLRHYLKWIRQHHLPNGYISDTLFSDASYTTKQAFYGTVDSGEWTGMYLAAESLRLMATRSPDAERAVIETSERICQLFEVTSMNQPQPGYMARFWAPFGKDALWDAIYDAADPAYATGTFQGEQIFYHGHTSRDMYQGAMTGLGLAYDALQTAAPKKRIRDTVLAFVSELITERKAVPVKVVWGTTSYPLPFFVDLEHVVLVPDEMTDGAIFIRIGTEEDGSNYDKSEIRGVREFFPSFSPVLKQLLMQIPIIGPPAAALLPPINRPGSSVSLSYFLRMALHMSADVLPGEADYPRVHDLRQRIEAHFMSRKQQIIPVIKEWAYFHANNCWASYFGLAIAYHPTYGSMRIETDPEYRAAAQEMLVQRLWPVVKDHKNLYFTFITASQAPPGTVDAATLLDAKAQLDQIRPPPKTRGWIDNTGKYPSDPDCQDSGVEGAPMSTIATNIADRIPVDFIWQHHPFRLQTWAPTDNFVMTGNDYLIAYWLGRYEGFMDDDAPNTCMRWQAQ